MIDLVVGFDPGSSLGRAFYSANPFQLELLLMEPEVVFLPRKSIELYEKNRVGSTAPENAAWVEFQDKCWAVGFLAKSRFHGDLGLAELKFERAIYKVLAMVGAIAQRKSLPEQFSLALGLLLPWGEYQDRDRFERLVRDALCNFCFRGKHYSVELEVFECLPEGMGLIARGRDPGVSISQQNIAVVMIGYRNASILVMERGEMTLGATSDLGFIRLIEKVQSCTSGLKADQLTAAISRAGPKVKPKAFAHLTRSSNRSLQIEEAEQIAEATRVFRAEHWQMLKSWLQNKITIPIDEPLASGGTSHNYRHELNDFFGPAKINWCEHLEERIHNDFKDAVLKFDLYYRLADIYGFFFYLQRRLESQFAGLEV